MRILVIDDDERVARALARILRPHDVETCTHPKEAVRMLVEAPTRFSLVFCDVLMPELSGVEVFRRVVAEAPTLAERFVFMTGAVPAEAEKFLRGVAATRLSKPFDAQEVRALVHKVLEEAEHD